MLDLPVVEHDAYSFFLGPPGTAAHICHRFAFESETIRVDDRVLANLEKVQSKGAIQLCHLLAHLPKSGNPVLLAAKCQELLGAGI